MSKYEKKKFNFFSYSISGDDVIDPDEVVLITLEVPPAERAGHVSQEVQIGLVHG